ncbi:hypothetical protein Microterr_15270 [Microbacterium terricola]|uniref:N-acetyltransferase domain-containing protein n=1 Tax=Microbacterium terricola TaxID=344163 RepID=A0ABM8DYZ9_9MICO|nr:hypothetical protein Microterr_15270 [Microbacterium terricola]
MIRQTTALTIERIAVPEHPMAADAEPFAAIARISNAMCRHDTGNANFDTTPAEMLPAWQDTTDRLHLGFAARMDGDIVGIGTLQVPREEGATDVELDLIMDPDRWGEGVEDQLLDRLEAEARSLGRSVLQTYTLHRAGSDGTRLTAPTGFGSVPHDRQTALLLAHGYTLEQIERNSVLDLTGGLERLERMQAEAQAFAGDDFRVVAWTMPTPDEFAEGFAYAISRMSTDVPTAGMEWTEEHWDIERVRRREARLTASGLTVSVACVQHVPSGRIAAYTELVIGAEPAAVTHQWGTLVLREFRGRRLGTLVKCANLLRWRSLAPESPRVSTFNAEENRPMLDVNEAMGFVPASVAGGWKKTLG